MLSKLISILFPKIERPITLTQMIAGIVRINLVLLVYYIIVVAITSFFVKNSGDAMDVFSLANPKMYWLTIPSIILFLWDMRVTYKFLKIRLETNGYFSPVVTIGLFLIAMQVLQHPGHWIDRVIALGIMYYTGRKLVTPRRFDD